MRNNEISTIYLLLVLILCAEVYMINARHLIKKRNYSDQSVRGYLAERTCWWNEVCKEEFHSKFRCRCPRWSYCRAPGRYYDAHCSMTRTGYIWTQPETSLTLEVNK
ncbi:uncharacterized protein LOC122714507 isoform X1 [Apis laboriosa]|uniref:Uncharacterized protein LOC725558 n=2 Tax=Apis TaxID=7459 RepID=A0A7M7SPW7_APIME|nr:uncharacterized protein LOC102680011 [Apis dorsata]XP_026298427.1 uncharacterized protein LOC725558 [Apis mellifera]XP_043791813.1 uncharacterized protein LOC122714507 isoform X1 [Apis laboriosa]KAG6804576.1 hypothetical protein HZU73_00011 [Apis mellifera caucasica]KAG9431390.1 hypothetical protein HZU67_07366 [Apis mellifera carnica]|eukprot:XP_026298427.1 uncharacterized protein LOC725558 [Apis mellifera]